MTQQLLAHTPGPWTVWPSLYEGMAAAVVAGAAKGETLQTIAEVRDYRDARLIAAAPELLAALRNMLDRHGYDDRLDDQRYEREARAAIAKAEGRS